MARNRTNKPQPVPRNRMGSLIDEFIAWMRVRNTAEYTQHNRRACLAQFVRWATERGIEDPMEVTRPVLESYQRYLYYYRQKNGQPLTLPHAVCAAGAGAGLVPVDGAATITSCTTRRQIWTCRSSRSDCPRAVLNERRSRARDDAARPCAIRWECATARSSKRSTRRESAAWSWCNLKLYNLDRLRGTLSIWLGKGKKDRCRSHRRAGGGVGG